MRYFITFSCYSVHLRGDTNGSVDRDHNLPASPLLKADSERLASVFRRMTETSYSLDQASRAAVLAAIRDVCLHRDWTLLAAHVRTTHVHVIVAAEAQPEKVMNDLKASATRTLNRLIGNSRRWARHGSTRWLFEDQDVQEAIRYVIEKQGKPMALFLADNI